MEKEQSNDFLKLQKVLKRSLFFSLFTILLSGIAPDISASNSIFEQIYTLNLSFKNERIDHVLDEIAKQSGIRIAYSNEQVPTNKTVSVHMKTSKIEEALQAVLGNSYSFKQIDDYIAIAKKSSETVSAKTSVQQRKGKKISGLVTDQDGNPVIGGTVSVEGTTNGVTTDLDGRYTINAPEGSKLIFRYIGYNQEERVVKQESTINIRMVESSVSLENVVVIGYGQQKKSSVVSSINTITAKELSMPTRSLANNLAGQIAGVIAIQRSGEPGKDDAQFWIRGVSSFQGGTNPLVLVDGVPRRMNDIDVDEIETFTVLKDAAATAVYGAEGANGVVLITSKRGSSEKPRFDVRAEFGMAQSTRLPKLMNSYDFARLYNEASWEANGNPTSFTAPYTDDMIEMYRTGKDPDLYPNADFQSLLKDQTFNQRVTLNLRGGSERVRYFVSGSFYHEDGLFNSQAIDKYDANIGLSRYNLRSNIDMDVTKTTILSVDISGQYRDQSSAGIDTDKIFANMFYYAPNMFPLRFSDGKFADDKLYNGTNGNPYNFLNESGYIKSWQAFLQSKVTVKQKFDFITKGLSMRLTGSFDADYNSSTKRTKSPETFFIQLNEQGEKEYIQIVEGQPDLTSPTEAAKGGEKRIYLEAALEYERTFKDIHDVSGIILYMQKEKQTQGSGLPYRKQSVVARGSYGYDNRYMVEGSFGLTGSENFAQGYRYGIFPAVGVAWYASNEAFMKSLENTISKLKIRASFGITGNDFVSDDGRFPYRQTLKTNAPGYSLGFTGGSGGGGANNPGSGIIEEMFAAPYLSWETEEKKNIGLDLGLFRGRVDISVDFFKNDRKDILMKRKTVSQVTGFRNSPYQNFGKMTNKGFDGNIVFKQNLNKVNLSFRGNITYAKNTLTEYDEVRKKYDYQTYTGHSWNTPLLYIAEGLYKDNDFIITENPANGSKTYKLKEGLPVPVGLIAPGDIRYADLNEDGKIDNYDRTYNHKFRAPNPELVYGFGVNAEYKGFYAGVFFQGVANTSMNINGTTDFVPFSRSQRGSVREEATNHWSSRNPDNHNVMLPRLHTDDFTHNRLASTWWYRDASFIRLKNLEFGYNFDKKLLAKSHIGNLRIYVQGNNLAVWDDIKMWDPELGSAGAGVKYPINMTWTVGLEIGF